MNLKFWFTECFFPALLWCKGWVLGDASILAGLSSCVCFLLVEVSRLNLVLIFESRGISYLSSNNNGPFASSAEPTLFGVFWYIIIFSLFCLWRNGQANEVSVLHQAATVIWNARPFARRLFISCFKLAWSTMWNFWRNFRWCLCIFFNRSISFFLFISLWVLMAIVASD